ncbi:MAG TPA: L,D-transpeptidase family protein [Bacteriovoracaceae bacterium]|nr:L,D-transpeptidase family protein [Bacteriovoracaceae bacterium]
MKKLILIIALLTLAVGQVLAEENYLPSNILLMDAKFAHHVILVEKATHKVHLYENNATHPKLVKTFSTATGKIKGDKSVNGDHKTPEGIYTIYEFLSREELLRRHGKEGEIYGSGAFPMDYPNLMDARAGKSGGGIWLHSTHDDTRISKGLDSRGCVVLQNADLKEISQYVELQHTPIIVVQDIFYLSKTTWDRNRKDLNDVVSKWAKAWQDKDFDNYIAAYDSKNFHDKSKGAYPAYKAYKKAVFSRSDKPLIKLDFISIMATEQYAVVHIQQDYQSEVINDVGKKTLYLKKDANYDWKIIGELWSKTETASLAFTPSKRFFKE